MGQVGNIQMQKQIEEERVREAIRQDSINRANAAEQQRVLDQRYKNLIASAESNFKQKNYAQAKQDYLAAINLKPENEASLKSKIAEIDRLILEEAAKNARAERERRYNESIASAERNFSLKNYAQAKQDYLTAKDLKPENAVAIDSKIAEIDKVLKEQEEAERESKYQRNIASAQSNFNLQNYVQAKRDYLTALELKPENAYFINLKIAEIDRILLENKQRADEERAAAERKAKNKKTAKKVFAGIGVGVLIVVGVVLGAIGGGK